MDNLNEFGQAIRSNTNNPHIAELDVHVDEINPWSTPQKIIPLPEEHYFGFTGNPQPITANQGKRVQLIDQPATGQEMPDDDSDDCGNPTPSALIGAGHHEAAATGQHQAGEPVEEAAAAPNQPPKKATNGAASVQKTAAEESEESLPEESNQPSEQK